MSVSRKKITVYLHPQDVSDGHALNVIENTPLRSRGDFFRTVLIAGIALFQLDKRIPTVLATLFDGELTSEQLIATLKQTTGWKATDADIDDILLAIRNLCQDKVINDGKIENKLDLTQARGNMKNLI